MKLRTINRIGVAATVVGTFKVVGLLSGIMILSNLAQMLAISPAPSPYKRVQAEDPFQIESANAFACESSHGELAWKAWSYVVRGAVPGPHRRGVTFLSFYDLMNVRGESPMRENILNQMVATYFCHDGPIAHAAGCPPDSAAYWFKLKPEKRFVCSR